MTVRASIVIDNYNYARFLGAAIDGALAQTLEGTEVVVVDDGSTDGSQEIIAGYGGRVRSVIKENGGQTSAFNAGLSVASGSVVCFLDSDDLLAPRAMEAAVDAIHTRRAVKAHWPLRTIEADGTPIDELLPRGQLADGDLRDEVLAHGPESYPTPPTSGNAWSREFFDEVMPLPEIVVRHKVGSASADAYLSDVAPLFGPVARIDDELGYYRLHGDNDYSCLGFEEKLRRDLWCYDDRCERLARWCVRLGLDADPEAWRTESWLHRFVAAREELHAALPRDAALVLVDGQGVGEEVAHGRRTLPFLERDGEYWGAPEDGAVAVRELERMRAEGAHFIAFAWPAMWWFDCYPELRRHLTQRFPRVLDSERLVAFDLRD